MTIDQVVTHSIPLIKRLVQAEWFTSRISACGIISVIYNRVPVAAKEEIRLYYNMVVHDETPMVRKAAYLITPKLTLLYRKEHVTTDIIPAIKALFVDPADTTRVCVVDCIAALTSVYTGDYATVVLPLLQIALNDASWRVRAKIGSLFDKIMEGGDKQLNSNVLLPLYAKLLKDVEPEVRQTAVQSLLNICKLVNVSAFIQHVGPIFSLTMVDPIPAVKVFFAENIVEICPLLGKDFTLNTLLPIMLKLLKDDDADVRLGVISKINILLPLLGQDHVASVFTPIIIELSKDTKWRVRLSIIEKIIFLVQHLVWCFFSWFFHLGCTIL